MLDILLVIHIIIAVFLIVVILLQKNTGDALAGLSGGGSNMGGIVSARAAANFFTRITIFLAIAFMVNALLLANLSIKGHEKSKIEEKLEQQTEEKSTNPIPMAK